jgi:hypothetical protein
VASGCAEGREHDRAGDGGVRGDRQGETRAVAEPGEDLDVAAFLDASDAAAVGDVAGVVGEPVVGEIGLPALVRHLGFEPDVGGLRSFRRIRSDGPGPGEDPVDRRPRQGGCVMVGQVPADGVRTGVQPGLLELLTQPQHQLDGRRGSRPRRRPRRPRSGLERRLPFEAVAGHEPADPALGDPVGAGYLRLRLTREHTSDDKTTLRPVEACAARPIPMTRDTLFRCRETPHSDVLNQDTVSPTLSARLIGAGQRRLHRHSIRGDEPGYPSRVPLPVACGHPSRP